LWNKYKIGKKEEGITYTIRVEVKAVEEKEAEETLRKIRSLLEKNKIYLDSSTIFFTA